MVNPLGFVSGFQQLPFFRRNIRSSSESRRLHGQGQTSKEIVEQRGAVRYRGLGGRFTQPGQEPDKSARRTNGGHQDAVSYRYAERDFHEIRSFTHHWLMPHFADDPFWKREMNLHSLIMKKSASSSRTYRLAGKTSHFLSEGHHSPENAEETASLGGTGNQRKVQVKTVRNPYLSPEE